jgi:hypothetical protein
MLSWKRMKLADIKLEWNPAIRAALCMLPMLIVYFAGYSSLVVPLGQGGFFYSTLVLPQKRLIRFIHLFFLLSFGLGTYLLGGNAVYNLWFSLLVTFCFSVIVGLLSSTRVMAPLAFSLMSVYTAGINVSNPDKLHSNYLGFSFIFIFCALLSLLPFWKSTDTSKLKINAAEDNLKAGIKLGFGASLGLFIANFFGFAKLGWPPSAIGSIIRFNEDESKQRAKSRVIGTIGGAVLAMITFFFFHTPIVVIMFGYLYGILNALFSSTRLGKTVFFYTATILILYSINDLSQGPTLAIQRIAYNLVGVLIAIFVVLYPFPRFMKRIDKLLEDFKSV